MRNTFLNLLPILWTFNLCCAQESPFAQLSVKVIDDGNQPVVGAVVWASSSQITRDSGTGTLVSGEGYQENNTNQNGETTLGIRAFEGRVDYGVEKTPGFYELLSNKSMGQDDYPHLGREYQFKTQSLGKWEPWNPIVTVQLWRVRQPVSLCAKWVGRNQGAARRSDRFPALAQPVGYDLEVADWTPPYGAGKVADFIFEMKHETNEVTKAMHSTLTLTFSNPSDGILKYEQQDHVGSALRLPYEAPEEGYLAKLVKNSILAGLSDPARDKGLQDDSNRDECFFFRVRTQTNAEGKIKSANYGKIYGGFDWNPKPVMQFKYFYNPRANERNLEFDPLKNLLKDKLKRVENVGEP